MQPTPIGGWRRADGRGVAADSSARRPVPRQGLVAAFLAFLFCCGSAQAATGSYEAPLPAALSTDPDLCAHLPCQDVLPGSTSFSPRMGRPAYVEAYSGPEGAQRKLVGYVFLSTDIVDIPAYSGKPVVTLIGMDAAGIITGVKILRHSEPILLVGIPESELTRFTTQYVGKFVGSKIEIGAHHDDPAVIGVDAISGATVTVIAENQVILRSGYEVARQVGLIEAPHRPAPTYTDVEAPSNWSDLVAEGSVQRLTVMPPEIGADDDGRPYMDMYFGYLNAPAIGRRILGDDNYRSLMADLKPDEHAIFIAASGSGSFKGSGFVRGGIYDRIQVTQEIDTFTFRDTDYRNLYGIAAGGAPAYTESGIFVIRRQGFSAAFPWSLVFLANKTDSQTGAKTFATFSREYWLPDRYLQGGRPDYQRPEPSWLKSWKQRGWELGGFTLLLLLSAWMFINRDALVRASSRRDKSPLEGPKYLIWTVSIFVIGGYALAQPSITQVLTWFHSIVYEWRWELFLSDPYIFIFWWFIIATVFLWGRGLFCGYLCPYGAMSEVIHNVAGKLGMKRWQFYLPRKWHDRAKWLKYFIFAGLLALSFYSMPLAERAAEIEPFKTTFLVGVWNRSWPFVTYWIVLIVAAVFMERPFCKYLCPLGAALAVPSTFRLFPLRRKSECTSCQACAKGCTQLAIDAKGRIDQRECMLCLDCMVLYYDSHTCPPLVYERKAREKAGLPLTPINARGYFQPVSGSAPLPVDTMAPSGQAGTRWTDELWFHLFPWSVRVGQDLLVIRVIAAALLVVVTGAWGLLAAQRVAPVIVLVWWLGWSVYEVLTRLHYKPVVKEGVWWGHQYRAASLGDMIAYVTTKNLLVAALLFVVLAALGRLDLPAMPGMPWSAG